MNFDNVEVKGGYESKYMELGPQVVKITNIKAGTSSKKGTPFVEIVAEDKAGLTCTTNFYFAPGKNTEISVQTLYNYIAVTNGLNIETEKDKVKATIGNFASYDDLASKLSTLLVGKPFAIVIKGEYVDNKDATKDSWVKGVLSSTVATAANVGTLKYDPSKIGGTLIKGTTTGTLSAQAQVSAPSTAAWN